MANTKMTKKDYFAILATIVTETNPANASDILAFIDHEVELLNKKNSSKNGKPTKTQAENEGIKVIVLEALEALGRPATLTEIQQSDPRLQTRENGEILTSQKLSAIIKLMIDKDGTVVRTVEKKKALFSLAQ